MSEKLSVQAAPVLLFFPIFFKLPIYSYILSKHCPIFMEKADNQPMEKLFP